jgi:hypothetical protein
VKPYLSVCAIYKDEASYLHEWVEFHRLVGVERFFLYDNRSTDEHLELLGPYLEQGVVTVRDWPAHPGQMPAYRDCIERHRDDSRWIAFIDVDEFLFSPTGQPVSEILTEYEQWPGLVVNRPAFGPSGHSTRPQGLVIENYVWRAPAGNTIKSVVDPSRVVDCKTPHSFVYADGVLPVNEHKQPVDGFRTQDASIERLRVNHYHTKSEQEWRDKFTRPRADTGELRKVTGLGPRTYRGKVHDDSITIYVPALRERLMRVDARR